MTILKSGIVNPEIWSVIAHSRILLINHGRFGDTWCVKKVGSDELISSLPEEGSKFPRLTLVKRLALANKNLSGLAHYKWIICSKLKTFP